MPFDASLWALLTTIRQRAKSELHLMQIFDSPPSSRSVVDGLDDETGWDVLRVFAAVDEAKATIEKAEGDATGVLNMSGVFTAEERRRRAAAAVATAERESTDDLDRAERILGAAKDRLTRAAIPARPGSDTAAQEAALGNYRADIRMVLDAVRADHDSLCRAMLDRLQAFVDERDRLGVWLLAASSWPRLYFESRLSDPNAVVAAHLRYQAEVPGVITPLDTEDGKTARRLLGLWDRKGGAIKYGLADLMVPARTAARMALGALRDVTGSTVIPGDPPSSGSAAI